MGPFFFLCLSLRSHFIQRRAQGGALQTVGMTVFFLEALSPLCLCAREGRRPFGADGSVMIRSGVLDVRFAVPPKLDYAFFLFSFGWVLWVCSCSFVSIKVW